MSAIYPTARSRSEATREIYPGLLVQVAARFVQDLHVDACRDAELKPPLLGVVLVIEKFPGIRQGNCAAALGFDATTFGRYIDRLVREGYVSRAVPPEDRRAVCLSLTDKGCATARQCDDAISAITSDISDRMGSHDWDVLTGLLTKFMEVNNHPLPTLSLQEKVDANP